MAKKLILAALVLVAAAAVSMMLYTPSTHTMKNTLLQDEPTGGDFVMQGQQGEFDLQDYRGKLVLIYFGYTFCPDICPTNLALMAQALNALEPQELEQVQPVFISVDPERDNYQHLHNYSQYFHPKILGVTADASTIAEVAAHYGAAYRKVEGESAGGYLVDHSSFTYLVDANGSLAEIFPHAADPQKVVSTLRTYLADN